MCNFSPEEKDAIVKDVLKELRKVTIKITSVDGGEIPKYACKGDSAFDIYATEDFDINPQQTLVIKTGIRVAVPEGYCLEIRPRSGISKNTPVRVSNAPGTIDPGYRGEVGILLTNTSLSGEDKYSIDVRNNPHGIYCIKKGDRIAQGVVSLAIKAEFEILSNEEFDKLDSERGKGGFGSTGI